MNFDDPERLLGCMDCGRCESCVNRSQANYEHSSVTEAFKQWAYDAVDRWDGQCNADLMELIRCEFGQTVNQFYGLDQNGETWHQLARCREILKAIREDCKAVLSQLDALADAMKTPEFLEKSRGILRNYVG